MSKILEAPLHFTWGGDFKSVTDQGVLEGDGIVFGSETDHDLSSFKDFFTKDTFVHPEDSFTTTLFMEHGFKYRKPIGKAVMSKSDTGWQVSAKLNLDDPVVKQEFEDIKSGGWGFSTGAVSHVVERDKKSNGTHFIRQWAVGELSITKTPAEPKALIHNVKSLDDFYGDSENKDGMYDMGGEPMDMEDQGNPMDEKIVEVLGSLVIEVSNIKKMLLEWHNAAMAGKQNESESTQPNDSTDDELTVLKSEFMELTTKNTELQSSFNEKEALLSEKMALLSETQADNESKAQEIKTLEEALITAQSEIDKLKTSLENEKRVNLALGIQNFNK